MTRSYRKTPMFSMCSYSEGEMRWYRKYRWHKERTAVRGALAHGDYDLPTQQIEPWDEWDCPRDGIHYDADADKNRMRK